MAPDRTPGDTAAKRRSRVANIAKKLPTALIVYFIQCICVAINAMNPVASPVREICSADGGREQIVPISGLSSDVRSYFAFHPHQALSPSIMPSCHNSKASSRRGISLLDTQPKHKHMRPKSHTQSWPCKARDNRKRRVFCAAAGISANRCSGMGGGPMRNATLPARRRCASANRLRMRGSHRRCIDNVATKHPPATTGRKACTH